MSIFIPVGYLKSCGIYLCDHMDPGISIIILNWNGWRDTIECLESLYKIDYINFDVILLDNGSKDRSLEEIKAYLEGRTQVTSKFFDYTKENKPIKTLEYTNREAELGGGREKEIVDLPSNEKLVLIKNDKNYGFAEGNNIGIRYALKAFDPEYVLLLNNDTVVKGDLLNKLVNAIDGDEHIGFAGPIIYKYNCHGRTDIISVAGVDLIMSKGSYHRIGSGEVDRGQYHETATVDCVEGSCLLIRRAALDKIGLLDANYFLFWEETDLCRRGFEAGYSCIIVPTTGIWHKTSSSKPGELVTYYKTRNRLWFVESHATKQELLSFLGYFCLFQFWATIASYIYRKDPERLSGFLKGVLHGILPKKAVQ
jgi:GT2 family glycosyltransferase